MGSVCRHDLWLEETVFSVCFGSVDPYYVVVVCNKTSRLILLYYHLYNCLHCC